MSNFSRCRSKVFYQSDDVWAPTPTLIQGQTDRARINSSSDEGSFTTGESLRDRESKFRRDSPTHKSQDSGFSDSGESNAAEGGSQGKPDCEVNFHSLPVEPIYDTPRKPAQMVTPKVAAINRRNHILNGSPFIEDCQLEFKSLDTLPLPSAESTPKDKFKQTKSLPSVKLPLEPEKSSVVSKAMPFTNGVSENGTMTKKSMSTKALQITPEDHKTDKCFSSRVQLKCNLVRNFFKLDGRVSTKRNAATLTSGVSKRLHSGSCDTLLRTTDTNSENQGSSCKKALHSDKVSDDIKVNTTRTYYTVSKTSRRRWSQVETKEMRDDATGSLPRWCNVEKFAVPISLAEESEVVEAHELMSKHRQCQLSTDKESRSTSVGLWLEELSWLCESECLHMLQSKSLANDVSNMAVLLARNSRDTVREIQRRAHTISTEFSKLCQRLECYLFEQVRPLAQGLAIHIEEFLEDYEEQTSNTTGTIHQLQKEVRGSCERLKSCPESNSRELVQLVAGLGHSFTGLVDNMLAKEIKTLLESLEDPFTELGLRTALSNLVALGLEGGHMCRLLASGGAVRSLLALCVHPGVQRTRPLALRALATLCCVTQAIRELEKAGGVEVLSDILCDKQGDEEEKSEAAGVLAQITSPWIEDNHRVEGLNSHLNKIVHALTEMSGNSGSSETFLLCAAALANLTFMEAEAVSAMRRCGTHNQLIIAVRNHPDMSVFTKDQIATIMANMAASTSCRRALSECGGVAALLCLLQLRPSPLERAAEASATERVQQKAAIALSRLCSEEGVQEQVVALQGLERLVKLCKDENERNHSDAVLLACLAALRKLAVYCKDDQLQGLEASELVQPKLLDAFLQYSSRQESYV